jgi:hypothetical protein
MNNQQGSQPAASAVSGDNANPVETDSGDTSIQESHAICQRALADAFMRIFAGEL